MDCECSQLASAFLGRNSFDSHFPVSFQQVESRPRLWLWDCNGLCCTLTPPIGGINHAARTTLAKDLCWRCDDYRWLRYSPTGYVTDAGDSHKPKNKSCSRAQRRQAGHSSIRRPTLCRLKFVEPLLHQHLSDAALDDQRANKLPWSSGRASGHRICLRYLLGHRTRTANRDLAGNRNGGSQYLELFCSNRTAAS